MVQSVEDSGILWERAFGADPRGTDLAQKPFTNLKYLNIPYLFHGKIRLSELETPVQVGETNRKRNTCIMLTNNVVQM